MKNVKYNKKMTMLILLFIIILNIFSYSAIVSDNDGSAFVSKSEFEALKTDFANQINNYQSSIDGKIDGAIASYLAGIKLQKNYKFFGNNKIYNFTELKKQYIYKVRRMLENKTNIDYQFKSLPSHYSVKNIKRKKKSELI